MGLEGKLSVGTRNSKAPMSQAGPCGRLMPRWSVVTVQALFGMWLMAGLPSRRASVWVGPPLSAREPRRGSVFCRSPGAVKPQVLSLLRLWPAEVMLPMQSSGVLLATIVFFGVDDPPSSALLPAPRPPVLPLTVLLLRVDVPLTKLSMPPPTAAVLPLTVLLLRVSVPSLRRPPPRPPQGFWLPLTVLLLRVSVPPASSGPLKMPPPWQAVLPLT